MLALVCPAGLSACSLLLEPDRAQCERDADCVALTGGLSGNTCVGGYCVVSNDVGFASRLGPSEPVGPMSSGDTSSPSVPSPPSKPSDPSASPTVVAKPTASDLDAAVLNTPTDGPASDGGIERSECRDGADCAALGLSEAECIDGACWPVMPECAADADCLPMGPEYAGGRCLQGECRPNPRFRCEGPGPVSATKRVQLEVLVRDSLSLSPLSGMDVSVCRKLDLQCATPASSGTTDDEGILRFEVAETFAGYLQLDSSAYFPALYFLPPHLPKDGVLQPFPLLPGGLIIDGLAFSLGASLERDRGHMMLIAEDCFGEALPGVTFSSSQTDNKTVAFYVRDQLPTTAATETAEIGNGGYLNFPAGTALIDVNLNEDALRLTTASVVVRAGYISVAYLRPEVFDVIVP